MKPFSMYSLSSAMLKNLDSLEYKTMTSIQEKSIPSIIKGRDILAQAKTGSGKTAAFGIGLLHKLNVKKYRVQALVLCPTRELAEQVSGEIRRLARFHHNIKLLKLTGGMPMYKQEHSLKHQAHIIIGTPGRIIKLLQRETLIPDDIKMVVLDEADRMLDMGFIDQIKEIISHIPQKHQTLCFSATFPDEIKSLSGQILKNPLEIAVDTHHELTVITQHFYLTPHKDKAQTVLALIQKYNPDSTILFCNTKNACRNMSKRLNGLGLPCLQLHGDLEQKERTEILIRFANKSCTFLVATDVAARGLDIDNLGAVINGDMPFNTETYIHRIGRTGRAGLEGLAFSLVEPGEEFRLEYINKYLKSTFTVELPDFHCTVDCEKRQPPMVTLSINGGRKNKISAGDILGVLTSKDGISGNDVGKIDRMDTLTFVAVKRDLVKKALHILENESIKGRRFKTMINDFWDIDRND